MQQESASSTALILAGAVANGAFEAGAVEVLLEAGIRFSRIVGASAGSLNAALLAASVRVGKELEGAGRLVRLWEDSASWTGALHLDPLDLVRGRGISDQDRLRQMLRENIQPADGPNRRPIDLFLVVSALQGALGNIGEEDATTFERVLSFSDEHFDRRDRLEEVFTAAVASAAFPVLYTPCEVPGVGPCLDGGIVNNTPVKYALDHSLVTRIFVVVPYPQVMKAPADISGMALVNHFAEMLIHERLYRDLREAEMVNQTVRELDALVERGVLSRDQLSKVYRALPWKTARQVQLLTIRPPAHLPRSAFSGFFDAALRRQLIQEGRAAARSLLEELRSGRAEGVTYL